VAKASARDLAEVLSGKASARDRVEAAAIHKKTRARRRR